MPEAIRIKGEYQHTKHIHVLTEEQTKLSALPIFGRQTRTNATEPLPPHYHENCFEIVYISAGSAVFCIDGVNYKLSGGDIFITTPDQIHSTNSLPISVCEMYWFHMKADPNNLFLLNPSAAAELLEKLAQFEHPQFHAEHKEIYPLIKSAFDLCVTGENPALAGQYITLMLYKLLEYQEKPAFRLTPDIGRAMDYIMEHITDRLDLDELAKISHLSTSQFKQKFKTQVGFAPRQFINYQKIEYSKELLLEGRDVTEIASILNFDNSSYFSVVFKRFNMCSPTEYLKRNR